ncbi:MAG: KEOPS complex subunit Pcc1 [Thermoplasmatota archaeon]
MKRATITLKNIENAEKALRPLVPEADEGMRRVEINISLNPPKIIIEAEDTRALRASMNSYLRWLNISEEISKKFT